MIKIGVIVPDRGDRPRFMQNFIRMINAQSLQPTIVVTIDESPRSPACDITWRYRMGYDWFRLMEMDVLAFMENDDWYSPQYLEVMAMEWVIAGRPELFGINYTWYYHIQAFAYFQMKHLQRSSAMATFIKPDLSFPWCADDQPYTDGHLWMATQLHKKLVAPEEIICLGIKHGVGKCGGQNHMDRMDRYIFSDKDLTFLQKTLDKDSVDFYASYFTSDLEQV